MRTLTLSAMAVLATVGMATSAQAGLIASAIFAESGAKASVPGIGGSSFTAFDRPYRSLNGQWWIITATISGGTTATDEVVIVGSGTTGSVVAQEGVTLINGQVIRSASIDQRAAVNDSGAYAFTAQFDLIPSMSGSSVADAIVSGDQMTSPARAFRSFDAISSLTDIGWGTAISSPSIDNAGRIAARTTSLRGINGASNPVAAVDSGLFRNSGATLDAREGDAATSPGGGADLWQNFAADDYTVDASGNNWVALGDTNGATATDQMLVYNNSIVLQEGTDSTALGSNIAASGIREASILPSGHWWAHGGNVDGTDWVVYGTDAVTKSVLAKTDDAITPGSSETWDDTPFANCFFAFAADNDGNYVIGGTTNNADAGANAVLVYNGLSVILREGDQVDLDGNGILDDDAFLATFNNDDLFLAGNLLYFTADIRDAAGTALGQAYMVVQVPTPGAMGLLALGGLVGLRRRR